MAGIPDAPEEFGPYVVYERLGLGGMATVHRAKKTGIAGFERGVALKRLLSHLAEDSVFVESFIREAKVASLLLHPNIAQIYDFGRIGGVYYIAMEHVDGFDVRKLLRHANRTGEPIPLGAVMSILVELCDALEYAHTFPDETGVPVGIVHRDVSPSNLIVANTGHIKVIDFGIAKASSRQLKTESGRVKGKLGYMSPEAALGNVMGPVSDMFSVGVVAHELLTARPLFSSKTDFETMLRIREGEIYPPSRRNPLVPPALDEVVLAALDRDPYKRTPTAGEMRAALEHVAQYAGLRYSVRDVVEYSQRIPRGDDVAVVRSPGSTSTTGNAFAPQASIPAGPIRPRSSRPSQPPPPVFQPQPDDDDGDVWADDQPNPLPVGPQADFSVPTNATANLRPRMTPPNGPIPLQAPPPPSLPNPILPSQVTARPAAPQKSSKAALIVVGALLLIGAGLVVLLLVGKKSPAAATAAVSFAVVPNDAVIEIGGKTGTFAKLDLPAGTYPVAIHKPGFKAWAGSVTLAAGTPKDLTVTLDRSTTAHLALASSPSGLSATLDGVALATVTPIDAEIPPGEHVLVVKRGADAWMQRFTAEIDGTYTFDAPMGTPAVATRDPVVRPDPPDRGKHPKATPAIEHKPEPDHPVPVDDHPVVAAGSGSATAVEPAITPVKPVKPIAPTNPQPVKPARASLVVASAVTKISGEIPTIHVTGTDANADVLVKVCIDETGRVTSADVKKGGPEIAAQMQSALLAWRYKPYVAGGVATPACFALSLRVVITHG